MFKNVIVKRPCSKITEGITSAPELGKPDYELALKQRDAYIEALKSCGVEVTVLDADETALLQFLQRFREICVV